tara:strand:+ start:2834 stop:3046 length:213 start_codon:yes stop_codon:yes gene_type:complete
MIMIDSKAGQRLARAKSEYDAARLAYIHADTDEVFASQHRLDDAKFELKAAAKALGDELVADGHHLAEDY